MQLPTDDLDWPFVNEAQKGTKMIYVENTVNSDWLYVWISNILTIAD